MSQSQITIVVNGEYSQRVAPERCDVSFRVAFDSTDADEALTKVTETTNRISAQLRELAPPKASPTATTSFSGERRPVALEAEAPMVEGHPVTKWSVQRIRKSSNTQRVKDSDTTTEGHAPAGRAFNVTTSTTYREETRYFVSTNMEATFHDFSKLEVFVGGIMTDAIIEIDNLNWYATKKTHAEFASAVRAGAIRDAMTKARDYASAIDQPGVGALRIVEINDRSGGSPVMYKSAPRMAMMANAYNPSQKEPISLEPEPVEVSSSVEVKLAL